MQAIFRRDLTRIRELCCAAGMSWSCPSPFRGACIGVISSGRQGVRPWFCRAVLTAVTSASCRRLASPPRRFVGKRKAAPCSGARARLSPSINAMLLKSLNKIASSVFFRTYYNTRRMTFAVFYENHGELYYYSAFFVVRCVLPMGAIEPEN